MESRDRAAAVQVLKERSGYEYEGFEIEEVGVATVPERRVKTTVWTA